MSDDDFAERLKKVDLTPEQKEYADMLRSYGDEDSAQEYENDSLGANLFFEEMRQPDPDEDED